MNKIRILTPIHSKPNVTSINTIFFRNLLPELRKKLKVQIIWAVYQPDKLDNISVENENEKILDIHNYDNFVELLNNEKPDLVYADATYSLIDFAISTAARNLGIPVLSKIYNRLGVAKERKFMIKSMASQFLEQYVPTDDLHTKKQFMRRGRFFLYKYGFLIRTLNAAKFGKIRSCFIAFKLLSYFPNIGKHEGYPEFANTLHWLESESRVEKLVKMGYDRNSLIVTGNPIYDFIFKKFKDIKANQKVNQKPVVLFLPTAYYEHGIWTKEQNESVFKKIIKQLNQNKNFILKIKLHPSSQRFSDYNLMLEEINENVQMLQEGDAFEHIINSDIVVSFPTNSTALFFVLLCKKPLILCNFSNFDVGSILNRKVAIECKNPSKLNQLIIDTLKKNPISEDMIDHFIAEFFYKPDGNASKRLSDVIIKLVEKKIHNS